MTPSAKIVVLTKDPVPGRVKTRLAASLGPRRAARLHAALAVETVRRAARTGLPVEVALAGAVDGSFARDLAQLGARVVPQVAGDLGARLVAALAGPGRRVALGTDCVTFDPDWLLAAVARPEPALFGPSNDGGYWTVCVDGTGGANRTERVFSDIPWSSRDTLSASLSAARRAGLPHGLLPACYDLDDAADLDRLLADPRCPQAVGALARALRADANPGG